MIKQIALTASVVALMVGATPAVSQVAVTDPGAYVRMLDQLREAQKQYESLQAQLGEAQKLVANVEKLQDVNNLGQLLSNPAVRNFMPASAQGLGNAVNGDFSSLGAIADRAEEIRNAGRIFTPGTGDRSPSEQFYQDSLERSGNRAARDMALSESVYSTTGARLQGLEQLRAALSTAPNERAVLDIQARIAAEQALIQNDAMRLQGVQMQQQAELALERQRETEQVREQNRLRGERFRSGIIR